MKSGPCLRLANVLHLRFRRCLDHLDISNVHATETYVTSFTLDLNQPLDLAINLDNPGEAIALHSLSFSTNVVACVTDSDGDGVLDSDAIHKTVKDPY